MYRILFLLIDIQILGLNSFILLYVILYSVLPLFSFVCCGNCVSVGFFVLVFSFITLDDNMMNSERKEPLFFRLPKGERPSLKRD